RVEGDERSFATIHLRSRNAAASLKRDRSLSGEVHRAMRSPQPKRCGLIEAIRPTFAEDRRRDLRSRNAAASLKRGLRICIVTTSADLRSRNAAASLKHYREGVEIVDYRISAAETLRPH